MKKWWQNFWGSFDPTQGWSKHHKILIYVILIVLLILLVCSFTVFRSERIIERETPAASAPPITVTVPPITVTVPPITVIAPPVTVTAPPVTVTPPPVTVTPPPVTPSPIIWPKTDLVITGDEARQLLTNTFTNRRMTGAHFSQAALYTLDQFKEIRAKMAPLADNHLPWPSLIDKALGSFQEPGIEDLPIGWAYPTLDPMYLIVILQDAGRTKIFGFDPLDKAKIWEVSTDTRVECAIVR